MIGIAGSVAVGKSTTARVLRALLARWPDHPRVDLVTTDGFLLPNAQLQARGLMKRKGFPESYDRAAPRPLRSRRQGRSRGSACARLLPHPLRIVEVQWTVLSQPDILIEGLNVLQAPPGRRGPADRVFASDFFDFSIYVDAAGAAHRALGHRALHDAPRQSSAIATGTSGTTRGCRPTRRWRWRRASGSRSTR